jgi:short-subunit dehydrogenase/acyl carrier protein
MPRGTVLVTGGTGGVAAQVSRWLAGRGTPRLVLASRSGAAASGAARLAADLATRGTGASVVTCDVAQRAAVAGLLAWIGAGGPALTGVMHAAGLGQSTPVDQITTAELAMILAAKADGAAHLDKLTRDLNLAEFVLFSSGAAAWGSGTQAGYAAANAFLDGLADQRRAQGLPATSVAWGLWGGGGMGTGQARTELMRRGLGVMSPDLAVEALAQVIDGAEGVMTVADIDWAQFAPAFTLHRPSPLIGDLPEVRQALAEATEGGAEQGEAGADTALGLRLAGLPPTSQDEVLANLIQGEAAAVLGYTSPDAVEAEWTFKDLGFDSVTAVELRNRLTAATGLRLPATLVFDYPTPAILARYLRASVTPGDMAPVLAEIDKLESMLSFVAEADPAAAGITTRLEVIVAKWKKTREQTAGIAVAEKLKTSTDDEVFDFIGKEFGIS